MRTEVETFCPNFARVYRLLLIYYFTSSEFRLLVAPQAPERLEPRCQARVHGRVHEVGQSFDHRLRVERRRASATLARADGSTIRRHWGRLSG